MSTGFANYKVQRSDFDKLCKPVSKKSILFFEGESGCGKTTLLLECMRHIPGEMKHIAFDCKGRTISVSEFLSRSLQQLGWEGLSEFRNSISSLSKDLTINIHDIKQKGNQNTIDIALRAESENEKSDRQTKLTEAWFRDVRKLNSGLLIIVDTFEQAGSDLTNWFCGPFLARVPDAPLVRVLVAGQKTPEPKNIAWGDCCQHHKLLGVSDAQEWMPVVEAMGRCIEVDTLCSLGDVERMQAQFDNAKTHYEQALPIYREIGSKLGEANTLKAQGDVERMKKMFSDAKVKYEQALNIYHNINSRFGESDCVFAFGELLRAQGRWHDATNKYKKALRQGSSL